MFGRNKTLAGIVQVFTDAVSDLRELQNKNEQTIQTNNGTIDALQDQNGFLEEEKAVAGKYADNIEKNILGESD